MKKTLGTIGIILVLFATYVQSRPNSFQYERSGVIEASEGEIFPYLSQFRLGHLWSPYQMKDPNMRLTYKGPEVGVGSVMEFDGNSEVGSGKLEITKLIPNSLVELKLVMTKPFKAENLVQYQLKHEATGTRFTWAMSGDSNFLGKLIGVLIDCEKMVAGDFEKGILNLKRIVESKKKTENHSLELTDKVQN